VCPSQLAEKKKKEKRKKKRYRTYTLLAGQKAALQGLTAYDRCCFCFCQLGGKWERKEEEEKRSGARTMAAAAAPGLGPGQIDRTQYLTLARSLVVVVVTFCLYFSSMENEK
jgi:hypothetical protein